MARDLAAEGFPTLRFDFRGRGDSEGTQSAAHIGTMVDDAVSAAAWLRRSAGMDRVILLGVCAGAMVAMGAAPRTESLAGLALWSPPPFHPDPPPAGNPHASTAPARPPGGGKKRFQMLQQYAAKLADPRTWAKLAGGQLQPRLILKILMGKAVGRKRAEAPGSSNWAGPKPDEILYEKALPGVATPALFIYGSSDPDREEAVPYYTRLREPWADVTRFFVIQGANHSFYSLEWKAEVIRTTLDWIRTTCSTSST
jgi:pimeloyl-ACP methyl ester carboxylesterase